MSEDNEKKDGTEPTVEEEENDEKTKKIFEGIAEIMDDVDIKHGIFLAWKKDTPNKPYIFMRGDKLTVARLTAHFTRIIKSEIDQQLLV